MPQVLLELHHTVFVGHIFIRQEHHVLFAGNLSLNRVVRKRDQLAIKKLVINFIWGFKDNYGVPIDDAYEEANNGSSKTHDILEELHFFILFTLHLKEEKLVIILFEYWNTK